MTTAARPDAPLKLRGGAVYGMDLEVPGMLWGVLVPAPVAAGRIRTLDLSLARQVPGAVALGPAELQSILPKGGGDPERPIFAHEEIHYLHQPVAAVAAPTLEAARQAAAQVRVEVDARSVAEELDDLFPVWPDAAAARASHVIAHVHARHGEVEDAFRAADVVVSETYRTAGVHQVAMEPHACLAEVSDTHWRVRTSTQSPFGTREDTASILGIAQEDLTVDGTWVGGGFGGKGAAFLEPYALVLARASGRPVRLALTYREEFMLGRTTLPSVIRMETGLREGRMTVRRVRLLLDAGASLPGRDFATGYAIAFLAGPYRIPTIELEGYAIRTHKPPFGPHRAPLAPQCTFVQESHTNTLARRIGVDPIEFRQRHAWTAGDSTALGQTVLPFGLSECLARAAEVARRWRSAMPAGHGVGVGAGFWSTGTGAGGEARLRLTPTKLIIDQGEREIGSGSILPGLSATAERVLGLPRDVIEVNYLDTDSAPYDSGVFGSRTIGALGQAVERAARELQRQLAARIGREGPVRFSTVDGAIWVEQHGDARPVSDLLTAAERQSTGLTVEGRHYGASGTIDEGRVLLGSFYPYTDFTAVVHVAEVAVDRDTGAVQVVRYAAFQDAGTVLDPAMARGQVEGGIAMGLGQALTEEMLWTTEGSLRNPTLLDYRIPTMGEIPPIEIEFVEGFLGAGPFGTKGLGEPPIIPVPATIANAVADAVGVQVLELPLTAERVARALKML
ncbi:MAG: xanthine dehydrogenase family protein molybdopterin-binding subunit [Thermoplasmata archaeon]